jgi:hypothetical protein
VGRFINADALVSTGQGILGNNMFAYCLNNPVLFDDPTGNLTRGQIHDKVLEQIIEDERQKGRTTLRMKKTCIYYNCVDFRDGWGFCDLYDVSTGEVWELKRNTCNEQAAQRQLDRYVGGALKHSKNLPLTVGGRLIPDGVVRKFTYVDKSGTYDITYWDGGNGILWYDYTYSPSNRQKCINVAIVAGAIAVGCTAAGFAFAYFGATAATGAAEIIPFVPIVIDQLNKAA